MPIDWDAIDREIEAAAGDTDAKLVSRISSISRMKDEDIEKLFPDSGDKEKLKKLLQIVDEASDENTKKQNLIKNIEELSGTVISLVKRFVM
jgi:uncharacterized protein (UPF0305 family)